ncbi:MAG: hypothetical protein COA79_23210 [Planctomycetota bacterium]|nr:MAG: hypothetical protein COA79_23210 [Planctomycetota bacterium]
MESCIENIIYEKIQLNMRRAVKALLLEEYNNSKTYFDPNDGSVVSSSYKRSGESFVYCVKYFSNDAVHSGFKNRFSNALLALEYLFSQDKNFIEMGFQPFKNLKNFNGVNK